VTAVIVVAQHGPADWIATRGSQPAGRLRVLVRPDGLTGLYPRDVADDAYGPLVDAVSQAHHGNLCIEVAEDAVEAREALSARGFAVHRHEHHYLVPTTGPAARERRVPEGFAVISAADADVDRLRELDDALRQDVPGAAGWHNDPRTFADQTFNDPEFDPATYLIAVHESTGEYTGLVRIWIRPHLPRLGLIGVLAAHRRQGLAIALITRAFGVVSARGQAEVTCEVDETNIASNALMADLGARRTGGAVELMRPAA
jgi:RimJ/RimL family protein N-acetyltransferase